MRESFRRATAFHESGHAVAAFSALAGINLEIDGSNRARVRAETAIIVALAGPAAQRRYAPRSRRAWRGESDFELAADKNGGGVRLRKATGQ
jgi:hypothetical protein